MDAAASAGGGGEDDALDRDEIARYGRQLVLMGMEAQQQLKRARVLVVGAGGLGSPCSAYLVAAGVGVVGVVDHDAVDVSNLQRQVVHREATVGQPKTESAASFLHALNSRVAVEPHRTLLCKENALELLRGYHVVVDCTDNAVSRYLLSDCCVVLGLPLVSGSALGFQGQLTVYNYDERTPCYRCLFPVAPPPEGVTPCSDGGVLGPVTGVIGSLQALEVIKVVTRRSRDDVLAGRMLVFDGLRASWRTAQLRSRVAGCFCSSGPHTELPPIAYEAFCAGPVPAAMAADEARTVTPAQLRQWLHNDGHDALLLVDVRPDTQFSICSLPRSVNLPLCSLSVDAVNAACTERTRSIVFVCRRGVDSAKALRLFGGRVARPCFHVAGGLVAWSRDVDPQFPVY